MLQKARILLKEKILKLGSKVVNHNTRNPSISKLKINRSINPLHHQVSAHTQNAPAYKYDMSDP